MGPQTIVGQLNRSMNAGAPVLSQESSTAPGFDPSLMPPGNVPTPNKSPMSQIHPTPLHGALARRGMQVPPQLAQAPQTQPGAAEVTLPIEDNNPAQPGVQVPATEAEKLIGALEKLGGTFTKRLDLINKHEERIRDHMLPPKVGPESQQALQQMGANLDSGKGISLEDQGVLDNHAREQLKIPSKIMNKMTTQQKLAEIMGVLQTPRNA